MSWWSRLFPARSVAGLERPTLVRLEGEIASDNALASPVSGITAALVRWVVVAERTIDSRQGRPVHYEAVASGYFGERFEIVVENVLLEVAVSDRLRLRVPMDFEGATAIPSTLPDSVKAITAKVPVVRGALRYAESYLRRGDRVRLEAHVGPLGHAAGAYRGAGGARLTAMAELGPVTVTDLSVEPE